MKKNHPAINGKIHYFYGPFSIAMLVYQRVSWHMFVGFQAVGLHERSNDSITIHPPVRPTLGRTDLNKFINFEWFVLAVLFKKKKQ